MFLSHILSQLHEKDYKSAAKTFLDISFDIYNNYTEVIAAQDIAIYGGLCGLATFDRYNLVTMFFFNFRLYIYIYIL